MLNLFQFHVTCYRFCSERIMLKIWKGSINSNILYYGATLEAITVMQLEMLMDFLNKFDKIGRKRFALAIIGISDRHHDFLLDFAQISRKIDKFIYNTEYSGTHPNRVPIEIYMKVLNE